MVGLVIKMKKQISFARSVLMLSVLTGCAKVSPTATSTDIPISVPDIVFSTDEAFECWTTPALPQPREKGATFDSLLVVIDSGPGKEYDDLYRFDFPTKRYMLLASGISNYEASGISPVSPDGQHIWYGVTDHSRHSDIIFVYNLTDGHIATLPLFATLSSSAVGWSPDSQCLFLWQAETVTAYRLADGTLQQKSFPNVEFSHTEVSLSPNGHWWAWSCVEMGDVCVMNLGRVQIKDPGLTVPFDQDSGYYHRYGVIRWSPDGRILAFAYAHDHRMNIDAIRLVYLDDEGVTSFDDIYQYSRLYPK